MRKAAAIVGLVGALLLIAATPFVFTSSVQMAGRTVCISGTDPTGAADSTAAINACLTVAVAGEVALPAGTYLVTDSLVLAPGRCLVGDGKENTTILVDRRFNPGAVGVVVFSWPDQGDTTPTTGTPCLRDLGIFLRQPQDLTSRASFANLGTCTSAGGGTGCKYPPAIYSYVPNQDNSFDGRFYLRSVRVSGAWDGIWVDANNAGGGATNGGPAMDDVDIGAIDKGLHIDNIKDVCHLSKLHFWGFGLTGGTTYTQVYFDGNTVSAEIGECDGITVEDMFAIGGGYHVLADFTTGTMANITSDAGDATYTLPLFQVDGAAYLQIANLAAPGGSQCTYKQTAGIVLLSSPFLWNAANNKQAICNQGGTLNVTGGIINVAGGSGQAILQIGSATIGSYTGIFIQPQVSVMNDYLIDIEAGRATVVGNTVGPGVTGKGIKVVVDHGNNLVAHNQFYPLAILGPQQQNLSGIYWPNASALSQAAHLEACGSGGTAVFATGLAGSIVAGTGTSNSCTIKFATTGVYGSITACQVSVRSQGVTGFGWATDGTGIVLSASGGLDSAVVDYACEGV